MAGRSATGGWDAAVTLIIAVTAANLFHQGYWQSVWSAATDDALRQGAVTGAVVSALVVALTGFLGLVAARAGLPLGDPPAPLFALFGTGPAWVAPIVLVLAVTRVTSSVDTLENGLAALVGSERPGMSLASARWLTIVLMVPAIAVALQGYSVLRILLVADLLCSTAVIPAIAGLWSRLGGGAALVSALAGAAGALGGAAWQHGTSVAATFPEAVPTIGPFLGATLASGLAASIGALAGKARTDAATAGHAVRSLSRGHN